jgi:hypothetical protein
VPGERWQEAFKATAVRCEVVPFLVSSAWRQSTWCQAEFLLAKQLGKRIFGVMIEAVPLSLLPPEIWVGLSEHEGGYAEYLLVPHERYLVRLNTLEPKAAAPLTDAALTPYRAITRALPSVPPDYLRSSSDAARSDSSASRFCVSGPARRSSPSTSMTRN